MTLQLGMCFVPTRPPEALRSFARAIEAAGLDELWVWEDCFKEGAIASAALALGATDHIRVGIGLMPVPLRNVALTAMELATLDRAIPDRLIAGIGHGVQDWMAQVGVRAASPLTLLREYSIALHRLLDGERVTVDGTYVTLHDVGLDWPPLRHLPLMLGGEKPRTLALSGELGDGTMLGNSLTVDEVADAVRTAREAAGSSAHPVVTTLIAATGPDAAARIARELPIWGADPSEPRAIAGDADAIAARLRQLEAVGVTSVVIQPTEDDPDVHGFAAFLGREVVPRLG